MTTGDGTSQQRGHLVQVSSMLQDLSQRNDPNVMKVNARLKTQAMNPDFYDEWD